MDFMKLEMNKKTIVELFSSEADEADEDVAASLFVNSAGADLPLFFLDFGPIEASNIACNSKLFKSIAEECNKQNSPCTTRILSKMLQEARQKYCMQPDKWSGPENVCTRLQYAIIYFNAIIQI